MQKKKKSKTGIIFFAFFTIAMAGYKVYDVRNKQFLEHYKRYTIATPISWSKKPLIADPYLKYTFTVKGEIFVKTTQISRKLQRKEEYFVMFSSENPKNHQLLPELNIPNSTGEAPNDGWEKLPTDK